MDKLLKPTKAEMVFSRGKKGEFSIPIIITIDLKALDMRGRRGRKK